MTNDQLLDVCLHITGSFEGGIPRYTTLAGNFDGMGMSAGILQWNAGQGTLQELVRIAGGIMGWERAKSYFISDIQEFSQLPPEEAIQFVQVHYLDNQNPNQLAPAAVYAWQRFLNNPGMIQAQRQLAESTILAKAQECVQIFTPQFFGRSRAVAFFFDVITQQGSMGEVQVNLEGSGTDAILMARQYNYAVANMWEATVPDPLSELLLYYANARAQEARSEYVWDCLVRRGTIATRRGVVDGEDFDLRSILD